MAILSISGIPTDWNQQVCKDLTVIKGIGPARQQWLRDFCNVRTLQDLATRSLDEIETQLQVAGRMISRHNINQWLVQARQLMVGPAQSTQQASEVVVTTNITAEEQTEMKSWKPFASFVVEIQTHRLGSSEQEQRTKVHHIESDTCAHWPGIETEQLSEWILDQLAAEALERG